MRRIWPTSGDFGDYIVDLLELLALAKRGF